MVSETNFRETVQKVLERYRNTTLRSRWEEAALSEPDVEPLAFWIRDSKDLVNIVWLTRREVRDITWYPEDNMSTFNLLRYSAVSGLQVREGENAAGTLGFKITGNYVVHVHSYSQRGDLFWVANTSEEVAELCTFINRFLRLVLEG